MTLDDFISNLSSLKIELKTKVLESAAPIIKGLLDQQISAGTDPNGIPWKPNQDGSKPLDGIQKYVHVKASGESLKITLDDPASYHQTGTSKLPRRQIVPTDTIPASWETEIQAIVDEAVNGTLNVR